MINDMTPRADEPPPTTPNFTARQQYLDAAPGGIDAGFAWSKAGGEGTGINVIDIEGSWNFEHEDLAERPASLEGSAPDVVRWRNRGTAVLGVLGGDRNAFGVTGVCPLANTRVISVVVNNLVMKTFEGIDRATELLEAGDIMLIAVSHFGPLIFSEDHNELGYIPVEWFPKEFAAIREASDKGVIVVEMAGNGAANLDDALYETRRPSFPTDWKNPFRRENRDSGAIIVGAGAPPPGTHGRDHGPDRSRLEFSNFGTCVDVQGWGREVTTCGYGDLQGGTNDKRWYTDQFAGAESAAAMVAGVLACIQGALRAAGMPLLTPARARDLLRSTGSPQQDAPGRPATQRIGNRPNLREMLTKLGLGEPMRLTLDPEEHSVSLTRTSPSSSERVKVKIDPPASQVLTVTLDPNNVGFLTVEERTIQFAAGQSEESCTVRISNPGPGTSTGVVTAKTGEASGTTTFRVTGFQPSPSHPPSPNRPCRMGDGCPDFVDNGTGECAICGHLLHQHLEHI